MDRRRQVYYRKPQGKGVIGVCAEHEPIRRAAIKYIEEAKDTPFGMATAMKGDKTAFTSEYYDLVRVMMDAAVNEIVEVAAMLSNHRRKRAGDNQPVGRHCSVADIEAAIAHIISIRSN